MQAKLKDRWYAFEVEEFCVLDYKIPESHTLYMARYYCMKALVFHIIPILFLYFLFCCDGQPTG